LGDAILCGQHFTKDKPFVVALGDSIIGLNGLSQAVRKLISTYEETGASCVIAVEEVPRDEVSSYGIVKARGEEEVFEILDLVEKPAPETAPSNLAIAARYVFSPSIYTAITETRPDKNGEVQVTDAIRLLLNRGEKIMGVRLPPEDRRYDIGNFGSYFEAFVDFALADPELGEELRKTLKGKILEDR
jgi:UTP--glucose-1-phosphate uridylyltransferase